MGSGDNPWVRAGRDDPLAASGLCRDEGAASETGSSCLGLGGTVTPSPKRDLPAYVRTCC